MVKMCRKRGMSSSTADCAAPTSSSRMKLHSIGIANSITGMPGLRDRDRRVLRGRRTLSRHANATTRGQDHQDRGHARDPSVPEAAEGHRALSVEPLLADGDGRLAGILEEALVIEIEIARTAEAGPASIASIVPTSFEPTESGSTTCFARTRTITSGARSATSPRPTGLSCSSTWRRRIIWRAIRTTSFWRNTLTCRAI